MLTIDQKDMQKYLECTEIIDFAHPAVQEVIQTLKAQWGHDEIAYAKNAFEYVRDSLSHSCDIEAPEVSCSASDVIKNGHGVCYAKSHLLAALLRGAGIPTGICYQKLIFSDDDPTIILHAVNAIYLRSAEKWIRVDARGNTPPVNAQFSLGEEQLAFPVRPELGEQDGLVVYSKPSGNVIDALKKYSSTELLKKNWPIQV